MVLTRAQRAQTMGDEQPPGPTLKASMLKAPARRGRAKKSEPEPEVQESTRAAPKAAATKTPALKNSVLKSSTSKVVSSRTPAPTRAAAPKITKSATAKSGLRKASVDKQIALSKSETTRPSRTTKPPIPSQKIKRVEDVEEEQEAELRAVRHEKGTPEKKGNDNNSLVSQPATQDVNEKENAMVLDDAHEPFTASVMKSASKLPRLTVPSQLVSAFATSSILSPFKSLGSPRKPPVSTALFNTPAKALPPSQAIPVIDLGSPKRPASTSETPGISASPKRPGMMGASTSHEEAPVYEPMAYSVSPKRTAAESESVFNEQASPKRLKTAISMPALNFGSPQRPTSSSTAISTSNVKSSLRSPVKHIGLSPKKSVTFRHPDPPTPAPVEVAPRPEGVLDGLVFYLDLYNQLGVDSRHLFAPLVEQLGGEWIPEWTSNAMPVTHVLFMNGELRTLEKVIASNAEVHVVNISWLLDCERENLRLDEKEFRYAVDLARVPGLHTPKPIKSMQNTPMVSRTPAAPPPDAFETPAPLRQPLGLSSGFVIKTPAYLASKTPGPPPSVGMGSVPEEDKENVSPGTDNSPLQQKTCPPKQLGRSMFSAASLGSPLKNRLLFGRRKSAEFAPTIGSPLRKGFGKGFGN
ncbi:hypothetical protein EJ08DRAFT_674080 [Tothia fuscella]|uniref:BRCT domain-containing protein n=1 Tax=Tothia fuscella TaxID=1048955 RepID=A0A9P4U4T1_9PEZI|nr:hypothetical protein EJ08DRAFT_674080 [Tothia fuscella]